MLTIPVTRGDTLTWTFTLGENITGWTPKFTAKPEGTYPDLADGSASLTATTGTGLTVTDAATGVIALSIAGSLTTVLVPGYYAFDLQLTNGAQVRTVEWDTTTHESIGRLIVKADVSRT